MYRKEMGFFSALKKGVLSFAGKWLQLEMSYELSEATLRKTNYCMSSLCDS